MRTNSAVPLRFSFHPSSAVDMRCSAAPRVARTPNCFAGLARPLHASLASASRGCPWFSVVRRAICDSSAARSAVLVTPLPRAAFA